MVRVMIEGIDPPGRSCDMGPDGVAHGNIHVGIGQGAGAVDQVPGDSAAVWTVETRVVRVGEGLDFRGPLVNGRRGDRFIYVSWGDVDDAGHFTMFRRAKIGLSAIPTDLVERAVRDGVALVCTVRLTDSKGHPRCARIPSEELGWSLVG